MQTTTINLGLAKATKNAVIYEEITEEGVAPIVRALYLPQWFLGQTPPKNIKLTIEGA